MVKMKLSWYKVGQVVCCFFRNQKDHRDTSWRLGKIINMDDQKKTAKVVLFLDQDWRPKIAPGGIPEWECEDLAMIVRQKISDEVVLLNRLAAKRFPEMDRRAAPVTEVALKDLCPAEYLAFLSRLTTKDV